MAYGQKHGDSAWKSSTRSRGYHGKRMTSAELNQVVDDATASIAKPFIWAKTFAKWVGLTVLVLQLCAFTSFIYEEALQASSFGVSWAIKAGDPTIAKQALIRHASIRRRAERWQCTFGWLAWWSHSAYLFHFRQSQDIALSGYYIRGVEQYLWPDSTGRFVITNNRVEDTWVGTDALKACVRQIEMGLPGLIEVNGKPHPAAGGRWGIEDRLNNRR